MNPTHHVRSAIIVGALVAFTTGGAVFAGAKTNTRQQFSDQTFAKRADQGNMAEVKLAQLAQTKSQDPAIRNFARRMIADHSQANDKLKNVASQANVNLPAQPNTKQQQTYDRLSKLSGTAFDRAYATNQVRDHEHDIAEYQREAKDGSNPQIKHYAQSSLLTLHEHLTLARQMYHGVESRTNSGAAAGANGTYNNRGGATNRGATGNGGYKGGANGGTNGGAGNGGTTAPR